jgi:hypothetical protein
MRSPRPSRRFSTARRRTRSGWRCACPSRPAGASRCRAADQQRGFINLIGLATHRIRGVAASRVNQIVTGYDVLKTKPKLIDKDQAQQQFNQYVGGGAAVPPAGQRGRVSNAQALLASQANEHGWSEWGDAKAGHGIGGQFGAWRLHPRRQAVGGLWTFNGGTPSFPRT